MSSHCDQVPPVNNARVTTTTSNNDSVIAVYECLTGFFMTGRAKSECQKLTGHWSSRPTCLVIKEDINVFNTIADATEVWWYYLLAGLLGFIALTAVAFLVWYCSCCYTQHLTVYPDNAHSSRRKCCRSCCRRRVVLELNSAQLQLGSPERRIKPLEKNAVHSVASKPGDAPAVIHVISQEGKARDVREASGQRVVKGPRQVKHVWLPHTHIERKNKICV